MRMWLGFLLLLPGPAAAPVPPPLALLTRGAPDPPTFSCFAPRRFTGATFELFPGDSPVPVRILPAEPDQHWVRFPLDLPTPPACFRCRYRSPEGAASPFSLRIPTPPGCSPYPSLLLDWCYW